MATNRFRLCSLLENTTQTFNNLHQVWYYFLQNAFQKTPPRSAWLDVYAPTAEDIQWIGQFCGLHPSTMNECSTAHSHFSELQEVFDHYLF